MLWSLNTYVLNDVASVSEGSTKQINWKRIPNGIALFPSCFLINTTPSYGHHLNLCYTKRQASHNGYVLKLQNSYIFSVVTYYMVVVLNLYGTRDQFRGRQFFHIPGIGDACNRGLWFKMGAFYKAEKEENLRES